MGQKPEEGHPESAAPAIGREAKIARFKVHADLRLRLECLLRDGQNGLGAHRAKRELLVVSAEK